MSAAAAELHGSAAATGIRPGKGWSKTMEKKTYTLDNFKMNTYAYHPISTSGRLNSLGEWEVNYSSILTELIHEAGRYCEHYASDLFIDWEAISNFLDRGETNTERIFLFGFRQMGVDSMMSIFSRFDEADYHAKLEYRSMWRLDIETDDHNIEMKLGRVF